MSYSRFIILSIIICCIFLPLSCVDESNVSANSNVAVHLYDCNGFPRTFYDCSVSLGKYPLVLQDWTGTVHLNVKSFPFNFMFSQDSSKYWYKYAAVYDNVSNKDIYLSSINDEYTNNKNWLGVNIQFPGIPRGKIGLLKFISKDVFEDEGEYLVDSFKTRQFYQFSIPRTKTTINGKFLFFVCTNWMRYEIISFDNYGEKEVSLGLQNNPDVVFSEDDIKFNPDNSYVCYETILPEQDYGRDIEVYLNFKDYNPSSRIRIYQMGGEYENCITVPANLPTIFDIKIKNTIFIPSSVETNQEKWVTCMPGSFTQIDNSKQTRLFSPADKAANTSGSTTFNYGSDTTCGVFYVRFFGRNTIQSFVTSKTSVTLGEMENDGLTFTSNTQYQWWVEQPIGFNSVDDYLSAPYIQNPNYTWKLCSEVRKFTTAH